MMGNTQTFASFCRGMLCSFVFCDEGRLFALSKRHCPRLRPDFGFFYLVPRSVDFPPPEAPSCMHESKNGREKQADQSSPNTIRCPAENDRQDDQSQNKIQKIIGNQTYDEKERRRKKFQHETPVPKPETVAQEGSGLKVLRQPSCSENHADDASYSTNEGQGFLRCASSVG